MPGLTQELLSFLSNHLNPFLSQRGLPPIKRFSLDSIQTDFAPLLSLSLLEIRPAQILSSPKSGVLQATFRLSLILKEDKQSNTSLLPQYITALSDFLNQNLPPSAFKGTLLKISPLKLNSPLFRGISLDYQLLYF